MKIIGLVLAMMLIATVSQAQCVAEITDVTQDYDRGSIVVATRYTLNDVVVQNGQTRYLETSGTNAEIIVKAKEDIAQHCENLIKRIPANRDYLNTEKLKQQKSLTTEVINSIKGDLVGVKSTKTEATDEFKGKTIKVTHDNKNTISNTISAE